MKESVAEPVSAAEKDLASKVFFFITLKPRVE